MHYHRIKRVPTLGLPGRAFTLIELLVVIAIIGMISSITIASLNSARAKARDAQRQASMHQIVLALNLYYDTYGCLPITSGWAGATTCGSAAGTYTEDDTAHWDYSSQGAGFLQFLAPRFISKVPLDPINNMTGDGTPAGTYAFKYFCYTDAQNPGPHLGYYSETLGTEVSAIPSAYSQTTNGWTELSMLCK